MQIVRLLLQEPYNASWEEIANLSWEDIDMRGKMLVLREE